MKLLGACLVASLVLVPSAGAQSIRPLPPDGMTVGELVKKFPRPSGGSREKVISVDTSDNTFVFAAAGSVQGSGGTFFRSDVSISNYRNAVQRIGVGFIKQGVDNSNAPVHPFEIQPNTTAILRDFIGTTLHETGLGAVLITAQLSNGNLDTNASIDGFSRIWTPQPGSAGSVSQGFPSVSFFDSFGNAAAFALGLRHDTQFRSNVGIVNFDSVPHTWVVGVSGTSGQTSFNVEVPGVSMRQVPLPAGNWGDLLLSIDTNANGFWWSGYGATVDNVTGDSWSSHASQP